MEMDPATVSWPSLSSPILPIEGNTQYHTLSQNAFSTGLVTNIPIGKEYTLVSFVHQAFIMAQVVCTRPNAVMNTNGSIVVICWRDYRLATGILIVENNVPLVNCSFSKLRSEV